VPTAGNPRRVQDRIRVTRSAQSALDPGGKALKFLQTEII